MICKDCGERDMRYDENEKSYHCNNCGSKNIGTYEEMDKIIIDSYDFCKSYDSGVLLCFNFRLRGILCKQCKSQYLCSRNYYK